MLDSRVTPNCIVARAVWGQFLPVPAQSPNGKLSVVAGGMAQQQMALMPAQGQIHIHHELRPMLADEYILYCVYCGEVGMQVEWVELMRQLVKTGA